MLRGNKVVLRAVKRSDISCFLKWFNDPEVIQYLTIYLPMTEMAEEKWIEELGNIPSTRTGSLNKVNFVIDAITVNSKLPIGSCGFHNINQKDQTAEFGIAIGEKDYWGKGCGSEAAILLVNYGFQQLNLHRISSSVYSFNERSLKMHRKVGFVEEGCLRKEIFKNGRYSDRIIFGLLREEWKDAGSG